ncbi:MAG: carboxypeptidase regulatory-like domain-containing protein [Pyrinomonadaceae bacterium]
MKCILNNLKYLFFFLFASAIFAQNQTIKVVIIDANNDSIVNALVTITNKEDSAVYKSGVSDSNGIVIIDNIKSGNYEVTVEANGFNSFHSQLTISKDSRRIIKVTLEVKQIKESVEITNEDNFYKDGFGIRVIKGDDLEKLPDEPEILARVLQEIAGPSVTGGEVPIIVDGFEGSIPPKELIREIRFDRSIFSAQYSNVNGGGIQIYTKSDVKRFSFGANVTLKDYRFNASNPYINEKPPESNLKYGGNIWRPFFSNKSSFYLQYNETNSTNSIPINAVVLGEISASEFKRVKDAARQNVTSRAIQFVLKGDISNRHAYYLNLNVSGFTGTQNGVGDQNLQSMNYDKSSNIQELKVAETSFTNAGLVNQVRLQATFENSNSLSRNQELTIGISDASTFGSAQKDNRFQYSTVSFYNDSNYAFARHDFRFGVFLRHQLQREINSDNSKGKYIFAGGIGPILNSQNEFLTDESGDISSSIINSLEQYRRTLLFRGLGFTGKEIRNLGGGASQFSISVGKLDIKKRNFDGAVYIQDSYLVNDQTTLSFGLRYENQSGYQDNFNFAPRIGVAWSKFQKQTSSIKSLPSVRIGFGTFYSRIDIDKFADVLRTNDSTRTEFLATNTEMFDMFPAIPAPDALMSLAYSKRRIVLDDNFATPRSNVLNIVIEKKIARSESVRLMFSNFSERRLAITKAINTPTNFGQESLSVEQLYYPLGINAGRVFSFESSGKRVRRIASVSFRSSRKIAILKNLLEFTGAYFNFAYRRTHDNIVNGSGNPFNSYDYSNEMSYGTDDGKYNLNSSIGIQTIFGINLISYFEFKNGDRFNIVTGIDSNGDGTFTERPGFATSNEGNGLIKTEYGLLDPNPSSLQTLIPRNLGRADNSFSIDTSISRGFVLNGGNKNSNSRKISLVFSVYVRNLTNTNNKSVPVSNMLSPNFLKPLSFNSLRTSTVSTFGNDYSSDGPHNLHFSARIIF